MQRSFCLCLFALLLGPTIILAQDSHVARATKAYLVGETAPLRDLLEDYKDVNFSIKEEGRPPKVRDHFIGWIGNPHANPRSLPLEVDPIIQHLQGRDGVNALLNFTVEGITEQETGGIQVPDVNGDRSRSHYLQAVNATQLQLFDNDGSELTAAFSVNVIWSTIGSSSFSDPIVQYDQQADRWLITDLGGFDEVLYAVSTSPDPLGSYYAYSLTVATLCDYPKYGVSSESYFFSCNEGFPAVQPIVALDRLAMLAGAPVVEAQRVELPGIEGNFPTVTPVTVQGASDRLGGNIYSVRMSDDAWGNNNSEDVIQVIRIDVDFDDPGQTNFDVLDIPTAPFIASACEFGQTCIPQLGSTVELDAIHSIVMNEVSYREFADHESIVLNFVVRLAEDDARTGIRWMELRRTNGDWFLHQEGTWAPNDDLYRWMGAMNMNAKGDILLGYAFSGENAYPGLAYTGRTAADPLGMMSVSETILRESGASRDVSNRYGDYFSMSVDPITDDFWFTGEYVQDDGSWGTIISSISLSKDTIDGALIGFVQPVSSAELGTDEEVVVRIRNSGLDTIENWIVGFSLDGVLQDIDSFDSVVPGLEDFEHTFDTRVDLSEIGRDYILNAFVVVSDDERTFNDSLSATVTHQRRLDIGIARISDLTIVGCIDSFGIQFTNIGVSAVDSLTFEVSIDGVVREINYYEEIESGRAQEVIVPYHVLPAVEGQEVVVTIIDVDNKGLDENPSNDTLSALAPEINLANPVKLRLSLDDYPEETIWRLSDENDEVLFQGGPYTLEGEQIVEAWCLVEGCYTFSIIDIAGDGLSGDPAGSYQITDEQGSVLASIINVNFGFTENNEFCVEECALSAMIDVEDEMSVEGNDGSILITPQNGASPYQYSIDGGMTFQDDPLFSDLSAQTYTILIRDGSGCEYQEVVTLEAFTSVGQVERGESTWSINPNPSENGLFNVFVHERLNGEYPAQIDVYDAHGRWVLRDKLPILGAGHQGVVNLYGKAAGAYIMVLTVPGQDSRLIKRVVRL